MIIQQREGNDLIKTYSSIGMAIRQIETGVLYDEAIDSETSGFTYEETNIPIEPDEEITVEDKAEAYDILIGAIQ